MRLQYQIHTEPVSTLKETVTESRWHQPWSEPVRQRIAPTLAVALIASGAVFAPQPPIVQMGWQPAFNEPVRTKPGLPAHQQQALAFVKADPFPESVTADRWWQPFREPVRRVPPTTQQTLALVPVVATVATIEWHVGLSEPVRLKSGERQQQTLAFVNTFPETITLDKWWQPFRDPLRRIPPTTQQDIAWSVSEVITLDKWWQQFREPIKRVSPVFPWESFVPLVSSETITADKWYSVLSEPVRFRPRTPDQTLAFLALPPGPGPDDVPPDRYFAQLSLPVRYQALGAYQQVASITFPSTLPSPTPPVTTGDFTVSGQQVIDLFPTMGVTYTYAPITRRTN